MINTPVSHSRSPLSICLGKYFTSSSSPLWLKSLFLCVVPFYITMSASTSPASGQALARCPRQTPTLRAAFFSSPRLRLKNRTLPTVSLEKKRNIYIYVCVQATYQLQGSEECLSKFSHKYQLVVCIFAGCGWRFSAKCFAVKMKAWVSFSFFKNTYR